VAKVVFHGANGHQDALSVEDGTTVMRAAVTNGVPGIVGECGGQAMCATCHVYVREGFLDRLPAMSEDEDEMLDEAAAPRHPVRSRLGCQLRLEDQLSGLEVDIPGSQA
jgi:ferredoxin, 2Fe-2S